MSLRNLFDHRAEIWYPSESRSHGAVVQTRLPVEQPEGQPYLNCAVKPVRTDVENIGPGETTRRRVGMYLDRTFDVVERDVIALVEGPKAPSHWFVVSISRPRGHHIEVVTEPWVGDIPDDGYPVPGPRPSRVSTTPPEPGDALVWNGSLWVPTPIPSGELPLDALADVQAPSPADGEVLTWDAGISRWVAGPGLDSLVFADIGGTLPWARISATPTTLAGYGITDAVSDAELAAWPGSANITTVGTLVAGAVPATLLTGTIPDARFPATLPVASGVNLTALNASNLASGTVPSARISGAYTGITDVGVLAGLGVNTSATDPAAGSSAASIDSLFTFGATSNSTFRGLNTTFNVSVGNGFSLTNAIAVRGLAFTARATGAGTIATLAGTWARAENTGTGTVTRAYSTVSAAHTNSGGGTVTNAVSHAVEQQTVGGTTNVGLFLASGSLTAGLPASGNWALYSSSTYPSRLGSDLTVETATGAAPTPTSITIGTTTSSQAWSIGTGSPWGALNFASADATSPPGAGVRARLIAYSENTAGTLTGLALLTGKTTGPTVALTLGSDLSATFAGNVALFGAGSYGGGVGVAFIANRTTAPTTNPTGGGILYAEAGALKWRGSAGTVTGLAPA